nr:MAG TPA: minor capsid protein [Caudoviricetes sp.]
MRRSITGRNSISLRASSVQRWWIPMTSAQRDGLKDAVLALTEPMIDDLVKDISRRIKGAGAITETAEYQIYRAQALGASKKEVERRVAEQLKLQEEVISSLFEYVLDKSLAYEDNGSLQQMADAYAEMTKSKTAEMLQNLWGTAPDGQVLPLQDAYARALDFAFRETATGVLDMETAIRRAVMPLAKRGLRTIEQKSGRSIGIEYACRRYIMDQLGALDDEVQKANHDRLGCDGWEISAHAACAPDHEPIQGRQYSDAEYEQLNNSLQRRIGHLNCGHTASPIILGVNAPQYTEAELKQFAEDNERGITYNGKHYTLYQAGQEQATMENAIRNLRRQILADEETKSPDLQKHQIRLRVLQSEYTKFCKAANLPTRNERLQVAGFGRSQASKAVWTYRRSKVSDVQIQGHTLYSVTEERINAVPAPSFRGLTNKANGKAQGYARELLRKVQNKALGTEAIVDFTADGYVRYSVGASGKMQVASPELSVPYYSLHNHASNDILSPEDVQRLIKYPNMKGVGAVGHAGALYTCEKVYGYNLERARNWFKSLKQKYPLYKGNTDDLEEALAQRVAFAEELRRDGVKYGLIFSG